MTKVFKKFLLCVCCLALTLGVVGAGVCSAKFVASAETTELKIELLPTNFNDALSAYGVTAGQVSTFTPQQSAVTGARMSGVSLVPKLQTGADENKNYYGDSITVSSSFSASEFAKVDDPTKLALCFWMYTGEAFSKGLKVELTDASGANKIVWDISKTKLDELLGENRTYSALDLKVYKQESKVPYGWTKLVLPLSSTAGTITGDLFTRDSENNITGFNAISTLKISQQNLDVGLPAPKLYFYDICLALSPKTIVGVTERQDVAQISYKSVYDFLKGDFYKGEALPKLPEVYEVFDYAYIGDLNYFAEIAKPSARITDYFLVQLSQNGSASNTQNLAFGATGVVLTANTYTLIYAIKLQDSYGSIIALSSSDFDVSSYGNGAWFTTSSASLSVDGTQKISYRVHSAFVTAGYELEITSTAPEIVEIVEWNRAENYIVIKAKKSGEANLSIKILSSRLTGGENEDGLTDNTFKVMVAASPTETKGSTQVFLWVTLGVIAATALGFGIYGIIKAKKAPIK